VLVGVLEGYIADWLKLAPHGPIVVLILLSPFVKGSHFPYTQNNR
jgi:hypothetical protein